MFRGAALDRRSLLALAGSTLLARTSARAETAVPASVTIAHEDPGRAVAADFIGLSYESALIAAPDYFTPDNYSLLGLIRALGARGIIRIGGNTSERTAWEIGAAIPARVPDARFAGAAVAAETDWIKAFADAEPENLVLLTRHYYAAGPATDPGVTLPKLLGSAAQIEPALRKLEG